VANALYANYRRAVTSWSDAGLAAAIDLKTDTIKAVLYTSGYTPNVGVGGDQFLSALGANTVGTAQVLTFVSDAGGLIKLGAPSFTFSSGTGVGIAIYKDTGSAATSPLIGKIDGLCAVTCAVAAIATATSVQVDPLPAPIASGTTFTLGGVSLTTTGAASQGGRVLSVSALSGPISQGGTGQAPTASIGLPVTSNGSGFTANVTWDATNGIFTI
jgi:hypothetical protein